MTTELHSITNETSIAHELTNLTHCDILHFLTGPNAVEDDEPIRNTACVVSFFRAAKAQSAVVRQAFTTQTEANTAWRYQG